MSLKKVSDLAKKFQTKLGQSGLKGDPLDWESAKKDLGAFTDVKEYNAPSTSKPQKSVGPAETASPQVAPAKNSLPADLKAKLDVGAPGLKGMILVTLLENGSVRVDYNADRWKGGATELKRVLVNALPGYKVGDVFGHMNPTWTTNYF